MRLLPDQRRLLNDALGDAYRAPGDLALLVSKHFDFRLNDIVNVNDRYEIVRDNLILAAESKNFLNELVEAALKDNPGNPRMVEFRNSLLSASVDHAHSSSPFHQSQVSNIYLPMTSRVKVFTQEQEITIYLHEWMSGCGKIVIFTRDMTWVEKSPIMQNLLFEKAKEKNLVICLFETTELSRKLAKAGAKICTYAHLGFVPTSRFTIINKDRQDAQVAVGRKFEEQRIVEEYCLGDHPIFALANDLVEILTRIMTTQSAGRKKKERRRKR